MKTTSYRFLTSLIGLACGAACTALAADPIDDDGQAPGWRNQPGTTWQKFTFDNPAAPDVTNYYALGGTWNADTFSNPATPTVTLVPGTDGHWKGTFPWSTNKFIQGVWNVNPAGSIVATVPNAADASALKYVVVQTVEFQYPSYPPGPGVTNIAFDFATVAVDGAAQVGSVSQIGTGALNGQGQPWVNRRTIWRLDPAPGSETVRVTPVSNGSAFDSVIVDTVTVPRIVCPGNVGPVAGPPGGIIVNYPAPTPGVGGLITGQSCLPASGSIFPQGVTTVNCANTDIYGGETICAFTVTVVLAGATITGNVELELFVGASAEVTFVATDISELPLATNTQTLAFTGGIASYSLAGLPMDTVRLSAKSPKNLRKRLDVDVSGGSAVANFVGAALLKGCDADNDNFVGPADFDQLVIEWFSDVPPLFTDFDGDDFVGPADFDMLVINWFMEGDLE